MLANLAKRFFQLIPVLVGVSIIVFLMMTLIPGDPVRIMIGDQPITAADEALLRHDMGLDRPPVERYVLFIGHALTGNFGRSFFQHRPVIDVIGERLPATIELTLVALIVAVIVGVVLGVVAAVKKNTIIDRLATVGSLFGVSLPGFWFGILLIMLFAVTLAGAAGLRSHGVRLRGAAGHSLHADRHPHQRPAWRLQGRARPHHPAGDHARPADGGNPDACHALVDARGPAPRLHGVRRSQGPRALAHPHPARPQERADSRPSPSPPWRPAPCSAAT